MVDPSSSTQAFDIARAWLAGLEHASIAGDVSLFIDLFTPEGWFRDLLCFSWDFRSISGRDKIAAFLADDVDGTRRLASAGLHDIVLDEALMKGVPPTFPLPPDASACGVQAAFRFSLRSPNACGRGWVKLVPFGSEGGGKASSVSFSLHDLAGHEEPTERPRGIPEDPELMATWEENREKEEEAIERDPTVLIVGAGHNGLMLAARCRRMGLRVLIIEKTPRVGDVWRNRYPTLSLHLPANLSSFVYQPWPKNYPQYIGRTRLANFMESYAALQELHVWTSSTVLSSPAPSYDDATRRWTVAINRAGNTVTLNPKHLILCTGWGTPNIPKWPGMDTFKGEHYHSDFHKGASKWKGKRAVVVGAGNAAADVSHDLFRSGAEVTMVQRSATCVHSTNSTGANYIKAFPEDRDIEISDHVANAMSPIMVIRAMESGGLEAHKRNDTELHAGLTSKGFRLTWTYNGITAGIPGFINGNVGSGTLLDTGFCKLIIQDKVKVKSGSGISRFEEDGLVLEDGTKLAADVVVFATGNVPMIDGAVALLGSSITEKIGNRIWGVDSVGELRRIARPTGQPGLWFFAGPLYNARYYSKTLALQILAEELGIKGPTPPVEGTSPSERCGCR
ncbi:FAD/NAD(P)-binding domain-containing protein [Coniophora puteana RWD-64-598 SS2]|uniref:FAD/NAD(P)-binding domain-containing protein n=1 Tax=Coniophora puteana (strain RWD-64-598) TaxID=741705 RepID=R7SHB5_CONPW|nr:FAD/NAD(P)-binding domain-containing protein [Coniophora puteana RWD-64-598 SS2]EIW74464.1 FAD/NAD(P)-binding domain-containing protein [Coniophora puteana RWD-64-598 SS2]